MTYSQTIAIALGSLKTGLTLTGQLVDTTGANYGAPIVSGFSEIGNGNYLLAATLPDDWHGGIKIMSGATLMAFGAINHAVDISGSGAVAFTYTVTNSVTGLPEDGVDVWVTLTNDPNEIPRQAAGTTNAAGQVVLMLDPGTYHFWKQRSGFTSTGDVVEVTL